MTVKDTTHRRSFRLAQRLRGAGRALGRRLRGREALPHTEATYRWLFENSVDGIYVTTPGGELLNANPALARMMGYGSPRELIEAADDIAAKVYVDQGVRGEYKRRMDRDGIVREFEYQVRRRDGAMLWLSDSAVAVRDISGRVVRYEGTVRDITAQKSAEAELAESRRHLQEVIDTVPAVINVKDSARRYVLMNRYMANIFGIAPEEAVGRTTSDIMSRYGAAKTDTNDRRVLDSKAALGFYEEEYMDATGTVRQWMANKVPIFDAAGDVRFIVTVALDIGERKRVEQDMRAARDAAEEALRELRQAQNSLVEAEKLAALGRLVAGVAHEVNNPVGISLTVASSLQRQARLFAEEVERGELRKSSLLAFVRATGEAGAQLTDNLTRAAELIQSFKQVAADRNYAERRPFDLRELTEQILTSLRPGLRRQNVTLEVNCEDGLVLDSYPGSYGQILTNLFLNALVHAFAEGEPGHIAITIRAAGRDSVELLFADNGRGMSAEVRRHAFDPFFTTRRSQGGTGLGLHIVYNIVTSNLGGRISLDSAPGAGTRIHITLPKVAPFVRAAE
jgi:PAS domain S-box-containing protein